MKTIELPTFGFKLVVGSEDPETPGAYLSGALVKGFERVIEDDHDEIRFNAALDGMEALILAHACAGVDVTSPAYVEGVESALDAIDNNL